MPTGSPESPRLVFKRVFVDYYLDLQSPVIADPTEAFAACREYLGRLEAQLGRDEFMRKIDDETTHLCGHVEQDLRQRLRGRAPQPTYEDLEDRIRECFEHALRRFDDETPGFSLE